MEKSTLDGKLFAQMVFEGANNLRANKSIVNDLNVFPVPDGDTGDNMFMTLQSGCKAIYDLEDDALDVVSTTLAKGMLMGARGNSGVILSRIFAGIAEGLSHSTTADVSVLSNALHTGVKRAYESVAKAVEGTILTVYRDACLYAAGTAKEDTTVNSYFNDLFDELKRSLERTPEILEVLAEAGVVDSGGAGLVFIFEGMLNALEGRKNEYSFESESEAPVVDFSKFNEDSSLDFGYCTEFLLQLLNEKGGVEAFNLDDFTAFLNSVGDSVVSFVDGTVVKVHVHTKTPGDVLSHAQKYGEFLTLKIENMTLQHNETTVKNRYVAPSMNKKKKTAVVAVAAGEGICNILTDSGVDIIVDGGQCMNPSVANLIDAFDKVNAENIIVLPNNSNVVMTADSAAELYDKAKVHVLRSKNIGQGYAAMCSFDPDCDDIEAMMQDLTDAMADVSTGMVCRAVRDSSVGGAVVKEGEFIGICGDDILSNSEDVEEALLKLSENIASDYDVILLCFGNDVSEEEAANVHGKLEKAMKNSEIVLINGAQPVYDYMIICL